MDILKPLAFFFKKRNNKVVFFFSYFWTGDCVSLFVVLVLYTVINYTRVLYFFPGYNDLQLKEYNRLLTENNLIYTFKHKVLSIYLAEDLGLFSTP